MEQKTKKKGFDDFLINPGKEEFEILRDQAKPIIETHIDEGTPAELILKEIAKLKSELAKDRFLRMLSKQRNIGYRALYKEVQQNTPEDDQEKEKNYTAYFNGLVDLVEDENGDVVFLVKEEFELLIKKSVVIDGDTFYPPSREQLRPIKVLPRAEEVLRHYENGSDSGIYADLVAFHKTVSELPQDEYYHLIAAWVLHTYLLESFTYSPYLWFFAIPERGKSRTGKGIIYVSFRGVHVETVKDAQLIRYASDLRATIFVDVLDLRRKVEKAGSEDFFLQRFERGAIVSRVLYPERGAFDDTRYFEIFGPTVIATNEKIFEALESRGVLIVMKETEREFEKILPDKARSLKERLVACRARHLGKELKEIRKPVKGRLGDILEPLIQTIRLFAPDQEKDFQKLCHALDRDRKEQKSDTFEAKLISIIADLKDKVEGGFLASKLILDVYNETLDEKFQINDYRLVVHHSGYDGYKRLSLTRASAVENCHSTVALC